MKIIFQNETKRIPQVTSYQMLLKASCQAFDLTALKVFKFYYLDSDGDIITISDQNDFVEAQSVNPDRIIIAENIEQANDTLGFSNLQRSSILNQSMMSSNYLAASEHPLTGAFGQFRGY
jgi:hypothetical protein